MLYSRRISAFEDIAELKPTVCESCRADGCDDYGQCEECLRNQAFNKEYVETHLFKCDRYFRDYHEGGKHNWFKRTPYRMPGEKPYLYYGIEIEVEFDDEYLSVFYKDEDGYIDECESSDECNEMLKEFTEATEGMFVYERDGSLQNGVEIISRPTSYARWTDKETIAKLEKGFAVLKKWGAYDSQPNTNGMHIHISKKFFDNGCTKREDREKMYEDMDWLFQFYKPELEKLGGRKYTQYCSDKVSMVKNRYNFGTQNNRDHLWNLEVQIKGKMKKGGKMANGDHGSAVTISGPTVEGRIFNSTLDITQIMGNIEIMRNFAHAVRDDEIVGKTLNNILHTKDNLYLDKLIKRVREKCYKKHETFSLERKVKDEMKID